MNKFSITVFVLTVVILAFTLGYKLGDSRGYTDGYTEGYRYDCRDEIATLYERVKNLTHAVNFTNSTMQRVMHENDSLKNPYGYIKRYKDSLYARESFTADSAKYHKAAQSYNDSLMGSLGLGYNNFIQADGKPNAALCLLDPKLKDLPECKSGWRVK